MPGPSLTPLTVCALIWTGICVAVVVGLCWALSQWSPR